MNGPDVAGLLAALARVASSPEQARALRVSRNAVVATRAMRAGRTPYFPLRRVDDRIVRDIRRRNAATQPRDAGGRFACRS